MGMDVHGLNPKINKDDFPVFNKFNNMEFKEKWKELDSNDSLRDKYFDEMRDYEESNPGYYFRNNVWWWRPLWDYCYFIADDLISEELWNNGHNNDGAGLNDRDAKLLGNRLLQKIREGDADVFKKHHEEQEENEKYKYPFDVDNVKAFAEFCIESGGFEIC
mgnify:CR=1 FL=1